MKCLLVCVMVLYSSLLSYAQYPFVGISVQEIEIDDMSASTIDSQLEGPSAPRCWRVYACLDDANWEVQAIFGDNVNNWVTSTTTTFYQAEFNSGAIAANVNPAFFPLEPASQYDSWFTIGSGPGGLDEYNSSTTTISGSPNPFPIFEGGSGFTVNDIVGSSVFGVWLLPNSEGIPGPDGRVLLAQITTDGIFSLLLNLQLRKLNPDGSVFIPVTTVQILGIEVDGTPGSMPTACGCEGQVGGCTFPFACNYSSLADCDDGSCLYPGCTDLNACNYNAEAGCDDDTCVFAGCVDSLACNYSSSAGCDDGSCSYPGCTEITSFNYDPEALCDDGSCLIPVINSLSIHSTCFGGESLIILGENFTPETQVLIGGNQASNVIVNSLTEIFCQVPVPSSTGVVQVVIITSNGVSVGDTTSIFENGQIGCTDSTACNFCLDATCDDNSCLFFSGCTEEQACNYDPEAMCNDNSCEYTSCVGCTYSSSPDYDPTKTMDDGTCTFDLASSCPADFNGDSQIDTTDLLTFLSAFDSTCE